MAYSYQIYTATTSQTDFAIPFDYIKEAHVKVYVNYVDTSFTFAPNKTTARLASAPGNGVRVEVRRITPLNNVLVDYADGSTLTATDLDTSNLQHQYCAQELDDTQKQGIAVSATTGQPTLNNQLLTNVLDPLTAQDAATKNYVDTTRQPVDAELTELATMSSGTASSLADLTNTEVQILDGATVSTDELNKLDGVTATTAEINYVDGVTSNIQTQLNAKQLLNTELTELASMASDTASSLADLTAAEVQTLDGVTASTAELNLLDGVTATTAELNIVDGVTATAGEINILDGVTATTAELNIMDGVTATTAEINHIDGVTSNVQTQLGAKQPLDADLTTLAGMQSGTASILASSTALTSTTTEINQLDGKTLGETTLSPSSDTAIPTSKAVNDRILTVTNALGGFVAIDNETSFPNTHPDPSSNAGTVVSIADVGGLVVNSSGVATNAATVGGTAVTINGIATAFRSTTITAGVGMQVQTTSTLNTYTYHKAILRDQDITSISTDIENFGNRYRVGSSDPTSGNDEGDLFFNTTSNTMKVYDGSNWGEVTSTGDFKYLFLCPKNGGSGAPTFDGSEVEFDLRENSNSGTGASVNTAAQLIVSVNGVVQEAHADYSSGLDGFVILDANTIKFCGAPSSGDEIFIVQIGSAVTLNAPANNTVSTAVLQNGAVTAEKLANPLLLLDNQKISFGTGTDNNLEIYHDPNTNYIRATNGRIDIRADDFQLVSDDSSGRAIYLNNSGGHLELGFDGNHDAYFNGGSITLLSDTTLNAQKDLRFADADSSNYVAFQAPATIASNYTVTLPAAVPTANGQALVATTAGVASWGNVSSTTADGCLYENDQSISNNYTIASGKGAHSVGPLAISATLTINGVLVIS